MESLFFKVSIHHALVESVSRKLDLLEFFKNSKHTKGKKTLGVICSVVVITL